jgi:hypothetical protein
LLDEVDVEEVTRGEGVVVRAISRLYLKAGSQRAGAGISRTDSAYHCKPLSPYYARRIVDRQER